MGRASAFVRAVAAALVVLAAASSVRADPGGGRRARRSRVATEAVSAGSARGGRPGRAPASRPPRAEAEPSAARGRGGLVPIAPPPTPRARRAVATSAFSQAARSPLTVRARRSGTVLIGEHALALSEASQRGGTWSSTALASGAVTTFPAPVPLVPGGRVDELAANVASAGEVLVARDGRRVLVVRGDGTTVPGEDRPGGGTILGAHADGARVIVWWAEAGATELVALDRATARTLWRRPGPSWSWDAGVVGGAGGRVALLAGDAIEVVDAPSGATLRRSGIGALRGDAGWPHPVAMDARGGLVVAAPGGVALVDPSSGRARAIATGLGPETSTLVAADDRLAYAVFGEEVAAIDLASGARRWAVRVGPASGLHALGEHLVFCDADGGATVIERTSGAAALRVGVGGCTGARARSDGTLAIAGRRGTWIVGSAPARAEAPSRIVEGVVTLDGVPAAGLPVLVGVWGVPLDGVDGCPALPEYAQCVLADAAGRFRAVVRARGWLPIVADLDAAARRAGRPRAEGGGDELDLDAGDPAPLRFELRGAEEEL